MRHKLDRARQFGRRHAVAQRDLAGGVRALDRAGDQAQFAVDEGLMEVARLALLLREQLLDLGGALDPIEEIAKSRFELRDQNVGEPLAGLFLLQAGGPLGLECAFVDGLDDGAKQRLLRGEVMVERLPGEPGLLRDELHRGEPVSVLAEDLGGGIEDAFAGRHLTILTYSQKCQTPSQRFARPTLLRTRRRTATRMGSANRRRAYDGR